MFNAGIWFCIHVQNLRSGGFARFLVGRVVVVLMLALMPVLE
jgi:hypothetical protein